MDQAVSSKKTVILTILAILLCTMIGIGFSYAVWSQSIEQEDMNVFESGCFKIELTGEQDIINLQNQYPIVDEDGKKLTPYTFTVRNTCTVYATYAINLEKLAGSDMNDEYIKVMLNSKRPQLYDYYSVAAKEYEDSLDSKTLTTDGLEGGKSKTYTLRIWIDESGTSKTVGNKSFSSKIIIKSVATYQSGAEYIASLLDDNQDTMNNDDPDENVRYIGANPSNYVRFNDELWRIIGVFYVKPNEEGPYEKRLKIIRNESIGSYSWDSSDESINLGVGVNEWSQADLKTLLNETYYNSTSSNFCYNGFKNTYTSCDFSQSAEVKGLNEIAQSLISDTFWNTGTIEGDWSKSSTTESVEKAGARAFYEGERSDYTGKICIKDNIYCSDDVQRTTQYVGKVGLMYPSDYAYATGGSTAGLGKTRDECLNYQLYSWNESGYQVDCAQNSWLFNSSQAQWTITPVPSSKIASGAFRVPSSDYVDYGYADVAYAVRPVVYLKSDVKIVHDETHDGSSEHPYELSL